MSLTLASSALFLAADDAPGFQAPTVEHSFFFDRLGDGTVIASVKAMVLLILGVIITCSSFAILSVKFAEEVETGTENATNLAAEPVGVDLTPTPAVV